MAAKGKKNLDFLHIVLYGYVKCSIKIKLSIIFNLENGLSLEYLLTDHNHSKLKEIYSMVDMRKNQIFFLK